mmetsp:Transcript_41493/g.67049  ORF Transcript_41493/g.67049 Transcript_41493/m.67049 type:complete len:206 (-) Transcript_41493:533-1150(-)
MCTETSKKPNSSAIDLKSHSSLPSGRPQQDFSAKSLVTGPRGCCMRLPLPTRTLNWTWPTHSASSSCASHFSITLPLPLAFLNPPPRLLLMTTLGCRATLNACCPQPGSSRRNCGDTTRTSVLYSFRASTDQCTWVDPFSETSHFSAFARRSAADGGASAPSTGGAVGGAGAGRSVKTGAGAAGGGGGTRWLKPWGTAMSEERPC